MIEFTTLTIICILLLLYFRPGKTPPLKNSLVIEHPGKYHATLAAQLNLAQPLIEALAQQIGTGHTNNSATLYFEVRDKQVRAHGAEFYLLAITQRNGMLYFEASSPQSSSQVSDTSSGGEYSHAADAHIIKTVQEVAQSRGIRIKHLEKN
ncbi:MAG: hypothetical protein Q7S51_05495 [Gallionellaceae bacterium]|nr:hypothetical protein [Gallionellaceae bacterium]